MIVLRIDDAEKELLLWLERNYPKIYKEWIYHLDNQLQEIIKMNQNEKI